MVCAGVGGVGVSLGYDELEPDWCHLRLFRWPILSKTETGKEFYRVLTGARLVPLRLVITYPDRHILRQLFDIFATNC